MLPGPRDPGASRAGPGLMSRWGSPEPWERSQSRAELLRAAVRGLLVAASGGAGGCRLCGWVRRGAAWRRGGRAGQQSVAGLRAADLDWQVASPGRDLAYRDGQAAARCDHSSGRGWTGSQRDPRRPAYVDDPGSSDGRTPGTVGRRRSRVRGRPRQPHAAAEARPRPPHREADARVHARTLSARHCRLPCRARTYLCPKRGDCSSRAASPSLTAPTPRAAAGERARGRPNGATDRQGDGVLAGKGTGIDV